MKNKKWLHYAIFSVAFVIVAAIILVITFAGGEKKELITVGFVVTGGMEEEGWNSLHYRGIKSACDEIGVDLLVKENVLENSGQCPKAIHELAKEQADIIILSSYGYAAEAEEIVKQYPEIAFYSESFENKGDNLDCYFARMYQARYLSGIVAGYATETDKIGYVAAMSNDEVNRGINAFTLGVQRVNPEATVFVTWTNAWDDVEAERQAAAKLIDECGADVLTYHQNQPNVVDVAEERGIASIGYHLAPEGVSENFLTAVVSHWDITYRELILDCIKGKSDIVDFYWFGMEHNAVGLTELSPLVPGEAASEIEKAADEIMTGADVFSGEIYDADGKLRCGKDESISDEALMTQMDWFVKGVKVYE